jgi:hypothetical protein
LNSRPLDPQSSALTGLRYAPMNDAVQRLNKVKKMQENVKHNYFLKIFRFKTCILVTFSVPLQRTNHEAHEGHEDFLWLLSSSIICPIK